MGPLIGYSNAELTLTAVLKSKSDAACPLLSKKLFRLFSNIWPSPAILVLPPLQSHASATELLKPELVKRSETSVLSVFTYLNASEETSVIVAADGEPLAGNEGVDFVAVSHLAPEVTPTSGFDTTGIASEFSDREFQLGLLSQDDGVFGSTPTPPEPSNTPPRLQMLLLHVQIW